MNLSHFWDSYFLSYGEFEIHEMTLRMQALRPAIASGVRGALPLVGGAHNNVGVSLRERRATMHVMLGV